MAFRAGFGELRPGCACPVAPALPGVAVAAGDLVVGQFQTQGRRVLVLLGIGLDLCGVFHPAPDLGRPRAGKVPLRQPDSRTGIERLAQHIRVSLDHAGADAAVDLGRAAVLADARGAGLGKDDLGDGIIPIGEEVLEVPASPAGGFHQGNVEALGQGHGPFAAQGQGCGQSILFALLVFGLRFIGRIDGLGGRHPEAVQVGGPEAGAVALEVHGPPQLVPKAHAVRVIIVFRAPGHQPEFARRHDKPAALHQQLQLPVFGEAETPGRAHADVPQGDAAAVPSPQAFGHTIAVQQGTVHFAAGRVKVESRQLLAQKVRGCHVRRRIAAGDNLPFRFHQLVLPLLHEGGHLVITAQYAVFAQIAAQGGQHAVRSGHYFGHEVGKIKDAVGTDLHVRPGRQGVGVGKDVGHQNILL